MGRWILRNTAIIMPSTLRKHVCLAKVMITEYHVVRRICHVDKIVIIRLLLVLNEPQTNLIILVTMCKIDVFNRILK